ncbi:hypothetical protein [Tenacibaculum ovolyticum]|uniref:hypothetical protein n=1 Tax=Tenacibaculum ovolyticum TaxID=104270 RepID=UPI003BA9E9A6
MEKDTILAKYLSNIFHIELSENVQIFNKNNDQKFSTESYSVFVHEYWHYLLNISTSARLGDFSMWYQLFSIFSRTLTEEGDGTSVTSELTTEDKKLLEEIGDLYIEQNQGCIIDLGDIEVKDFNIISEITSVENELTLKGIKVPYKQSKVKIDILTSEGKRLNKELYINNDFIDESIANCIEKIIFDNDNPPPKIPYLILEKLSEYYNNGSALSKFELAHLGTLSLLTTNPPLSLNSIFKDYIEYRENNDIESSLEYIFNLIKPLFLEISGVILTDMNEILKVYENREPAYQAIKFLIEKIEKAIYFRNKNLVFELAPFRNNTVNYEKLNILLYEAFKPCDIIQKVVGDEETLERDFIKSFETQPIQISNHFIYPSFLMQLISCQLHYFKAHWTIHGLMDTRIANDTCPFFTTCNLTTRTETPNICRNKPWESLIKNGENCVYGHAVANLVGHSKLK